MKKDSDQPLQWKLLFLMMVVVFAAGTLALFPSCGGGSGGGVIPTPTPDNLKGTITGYVTQSRGGPPVAGSSVKFTGTTTFTTTTDNQGRFTAELQYGVYDILVEKNSFTSSRIESYHLVPLQELPDLYIVQMPVFNPDWSVEAPRLTVTGISNGETVNGQVFPINVQTSGANPIKEIQIRFGNRTSFPDFFESEKNSTSYTWDSAAVPLPKGVSYMLVTAYDVNHNRVEQYFLLNIIGGTTPALQSPSNTVARAYTFSRDLGRFSIESAENLRKEGKKVNPDILELPNGDSINLRAVPADATMLIKLTWDRAGDSAGYRIYRSVNGGNYVFIGNSMLGDFTEYFDYDPTLTPGDSYQYRITSYNTGGESAPATTPVVVPLGRFVVNLAQPADQEVNVPRTPTYSWNVVSSAGETQKYRIRVLAVNESSLNPAWVSGDLYGVTSIVHGSSPLALNTLFEWGFVICAGVGSYDGGVGDYLAWSYASPTSMNPNAFSNASGGSHVFRTVQTP